MSVHSLLNSQCHGALVITSVPRLLARVQPVNYNRDISPCHEIKLFCVVSLDLFLPFFPSILPVDTTYSSFPLYVSKKCRLSSPDAGSIHYVNYTSSLWLLPVHGILIILLYYSWGSVGDVVNITPAADLISQVNFTFISQVN